MKLSQLLKNVHVKNEYADREITFITDDSRKVGAGCAFVCIKGKRFDGHDAAAAAVEAGAAAVICEHSFCCDGEVIVEDTRTAFSLMCAAFFGEPSKRLKLIGVTGTNGKTTTTFLIKEIFDALGIKAGLIGTVKNMIGDREEPSALTTPESFALNKLFAEMAEAGCEYCVMEVSSQALAQGRVAGCEFEAAVFSNLTRDHLDYHGTFGAYAAAKALLFTQTKKAILNLDDPYWKLMADSCAGTAVTFSARDPADYTASGVKLLHTCVEYDLLNKNKVPHIKVGIPGGFSVYNSLAAIAALLELGFDETAVIDAIGKVRGVKGRIEVVPTGTDYAVIIDYAHSPDGLKNILTAVRPITVGRILTVFGCGGDRDKTKRPIMGAVAAELSDKIFVTSDNPRTEDPAAIVQDILTGLTDAATPMHVEVDRTEAIRQALSEAQAGDTVVLAGKGHETYQILNTGKIHYDEREIVKGILEGTI
ncbi:MAG: UDP-N-acetylmuramoyl-L-alanyl-D-glutamate--2,6-diaminopimelate ligase [Clostridia bacterium]|nr:UDP-N-acetylmuramoyl-L-alanyl-D-glutamate--2,6-diaminopimelate ligase [Clostridia bacterium]